MLRQKSFHALVFRALLALAMVCSSGNGWMSVTGSVQAASKLLEIRSVGMDSAGTSVLIKSNKNLSSSKYYSVLKLPNPARLVIDIPDSQVATPRALIKLGQNGFKEVELSESRSSYYNASRITIYVDDFQKLNDLNISVRDNALVVTRNELPLPQAAEEIPTPEQQETAKTEAASLPPVGDGMNLIEDIYYRDGQLVIRAANGANVVPKNRFVLGDPGRLVVDLDKAVVSSKNLLKPIFVHQDNITQIRVGQFDEQTVRIVIEAQSPERIQMAYTGADKSMMAVGSEFSMSANAIPSEAQLGVVKNVTVNKENGDTVIRLTASTPIIHRIIKDDGKIMVEMANIASTSGWVSYDRPEFPQLDYIKLDALNAGQPNSKMVIDLKASDTEMASHLSADRKSLEITLMANGIRSGFRKENGNATYASGKAPFAARVVIDAGHGGKDMGANRAGLNEKDLNLSVALKLKQSLEARGVKVYMTRSSDVFLPLPQITQISNDIHPDLFVSVHTNSSTNPGITGLETYYYTPQSASLAQRVHNRMVNSVSSPDRGVRKAMFYVIHHTQIPAILCEMGYISNSTERSDLFTEARKQSTADAIADGVVDYLRAKATASAR